MPKLTLTIYSNLRRMLYLLNYKFLARVCAVLCVLVSVGERRLLTTNPSFWCLRPKEEVTLCGKYRPKLSYLFCLVIIGAIIEAVLGLDY